MQWDAVRGYAVSFVSAPMIALYVMALSHLGGALKDPPKLEPPKPFSTALASWYDLDGTGACGVEAQAGYRFASLSLRCGTLVRMCHAGCVTATMSDRGPYVSGRLFDLNANLKAAIGCGDLCVVRWAVAR
jgi:hypothetical protein